MPNGFVLQATFGFFCSWSFYTQALEQHCQKAAARRLMMITFKIF